MLLFRGADKECLNYAGQTAYQVSPGVSSLADLAGLQIILRRCLLSCQIFL